MAPEGRSAATGESAPEGRSAATGESAPEGRSAATGESARDEERVAAAQAYIDALVTHKADAVPFAPNCIRFEVGIKTGFSGDHLRRSLNRGPQYKVIEKTTTPDFTIDGDNVRARFDVLTKPRLFGRRVCSHVDETFLIPASDAQIHHIRASLTPFISR